MGGMHLSIEENTEECKPLFADKKTWRAYLILEAVAKDRDYRAIGATYAITLIGGSLGLTNKTSTTVSGILHRLARPPYKWIEADGGQIYVKPMTDVLKENKGRGI